MKKTYKLISVLLVSIMLLCSCSTEVVIPKTKLPISTPTQEPIPTAEETPMPTRIEDIGQIVYRLRDGNENEEIKSIDDANTIQKIHNYYYSDYVDESKVSEHIKYDIFGTNETNNEFVYKNSSVLHSIMAPDVYLDCYYAESAENIERNHVFFERGTDRVVSLELFEPSYADSVVDKIAEECKSLEDYIALFERILGQSLEKYELHCDTSFNKYSSNAVAGYSEHNFYEPGENEKLTGYRFYFTLRNGANLTCSMIYIYISFIGYKTINIKNVTRDYSYDNVITVTYNEIEEATAIVTPFVFNELYSEEVLREIKRNGDNIEVEFYAIDVLYGRTYLVFRADYQGCCCAGYECSHKVYVDYQRLQWKMALEGKT